MLYPNCFNNALLSSKISPLGSEIIIDSLCFASNLTVGLEDGKEPKYNKTVTLKFDSATATTEQLVISTVTGEKKVTDLSNISAGDNVNATAKTASITADTYHLEWQEVNADGEVTVTDSIDIPAKLLFENDTNSI